jgi:hypothetical protein
MVACVAAQHGPVGHGRACEGGVRGAELSAAGAQSRAPVALQDQECEDQREDGSQCARDGDVVVELLRLVSVPSAGVFGQILRLRLRQEFLCCDDSRLDGSCESPMRVNRGRCRCARSTAGGTRHRQEIRPRRSSTKSGLRRPRGRDRRADRRQRRQDEGGGAARRRVHAVRLTGRSPGRRCGIRPPGPGEPR